MLDELKEEGIVNKVGGRFKLSTLIQKRLVALTAHEAEVDGHRSGAFPLRPGERGVGIEVLHQQHLRPLQPLRHLLHAPWNLVQEVTDRHDGRAAAGLGLKHLQQGRAQQKGRTAARPLSCPR